MIKRDGDDKIRRDKNVQMNFIVSVPFYHFDNFPPSPFIPFITLFQSSVRKKLIKKLENI